MPSQCDARRADYALARTALGDKSKTVLKKRKPMATRVNENAQYE